MSDKELEEYIRTIEPNFDNHIEKGTIEMNNEYYNLLEERMARLINENQELKKQLSNSHQIKKQLEEYRMDIINGKPYIKLEFVLNQQKEFIEWLENMLDDENDIFSVVRVKDVLSKYKEIIGGKDER